MDVTGAIALIFFFTSFGVICGGMILARHRERMAIIEKGVAAEDVKSLYQKGSWRTNPLNSLKYGILLIALGLALLTGIFMHTMLNFNEGFTFGFVALFGGVGLLVFYGIARNKVESR